MAPTHSTRHGEGFDQEDWWRRVVPSGGCCGSRGRAESSYDGVGTSEGNIYRFPIFMECQQIKIYSQIWFFGWILLIADSWCGQGIIWPSGMLLKGAVLVLKNVDMVWTLLQKWDPILVEGVIVFMFSYIPLVYWRRSSVKNNQFSVTELIW